MNGTIDGITGPAGECICSHCQLENMIDGIVAPKENINDQETVAVFEQVGE